jgi:hypothetical protein
MRVRATLKHYWLYSVALLMMVFCVSCTDYNIEVPDVKPRALIMLDVGSIEVQPYNRVPDNILPVSAAQMAKDWFERCLKISGKNDNRFVIEIAEATTVRAPQASHYSFEAYVTTVRVNYKLYEPTQHLPRMQAESTFKMTREVKKNTSIPDRDKFFASLDRQLLERMDKEFPAHIEKYFSEHILMMR